MQIDIPPFFWQSLFSFTSKGWSSSNRALSFQVFMLTFGFVAFSLSALAKPPILAGSQLLNPPPNIIRTCCAFGVDLSVARIPFVKKSDIIAIDQLGNHHYLGDKTEGNGIVYTQRGGFIDLGHLRDYVDWTAYLYVRIQEAKLENEVVFIDLGSEGGHKSLTIRTDELKSIDDLSELAGKIAFDLSIWHEIATWFGVSYIPLIPERYSSFSPEDLYSNLLGTRIGIEAIKSDLPFDEAVTQALTKYLKELKAVNSIEETYAALGEVEEVWWTRTKALPNGAVLIRRNMICEGSLDPWLIPSHELIYTPCKLALPAESLNSFYDFVIKTGSKISLKKIFQETDSDSINQTDFNRLIQYISLTLVEAEGPKVRRHERAHKF